MKHWWNNWAKYPRILWIFTLFWLAFICWLAFLWNLGSTGLVDETEPLFAEAARQMVETGDWITPYFNGVTRFDKPPLVYWLMAIGYQFFGVNEWAVRLPSALSALGLTVFTFCTLRYFGSPKSHQQLWLSAWIGAALIAFNPQTLIWARTGVSDMLLSGCMGGALLCFFWGYTAKETKIGINSRWYTACFIFLALAVLAKGPVGIVLPGLIITTFLLYVGKFWQVVQEMNLIKGGIIFVLITLPWYLLVTWQNGSAYLDTFFGYHNFERFTAVVNGHSAPWYFYFLVVLVGFLPWSVYLPVAIAKLQVWRINFWRHQPRTSHLGLFALFWFASIFIFFSLAVTKLPSYTLPLLPAAAIMVALMWSEYPSKSSVNNYALLVSGILNCLLLLILAAAMVYAPNFIGYDKAAPNLDELVRQSGLHWRGGIIWLTTALIIALFLTAKKYWSWLWAVNWGGFVAFLIFVLNPATFLVDNARQRPLRQLAETITQQKQPDEPVIMIGFSKPSLVFYTQQPVQFFNYTAKAVIHAHEMIANQPQIPSLLLLIRPKYIEQLKLQPSDYQPINQQFPYLLIRVEKTIILDRYQKLIND